MAMNTTLTIHVAQTSRVLMIAARDASPTSGTPTIDAGNPNVESVPFTSGAPFQVILGRGLTQDHAIGATVTLA